MSPGEFDQVIKELQQANSKPSEQAKLTELTNALHHLNNETNPQDFIQKAYNLLADNKGSPSLGSAVAKITLSRSDGEILGCEIGRQMMSLRIAQEGIGAAGTFLRGQESINGFSLQFISGTSPEMNDVLARRVETLKRNFGGEVEDYTAKTKPHLDEIAEYNKQINKISDGSIRQIKDDPNLSEAEKKEQIAPLQLQVDELVQKRKLAQAEVDKHIAERNDIQSRLGRAMGRELADPPLSDISKSYLKGLREAVVNDPKFKQEFVNKGKGTEEQAGLALDKIAKDMVNNNTSLRYVSPKIATEKDMQNHPVWVQSSQAAILSFNNYDKDSFKVTDKIPAEVGTAVHTEEFRTSVGEMHQDIIKTPEPKRFGNDNLEQTRQQNLQGKQEKLKPFDDRIKELQTERNRLATKPKIGDHIGAFFKHGFKGVQGELDKLDLKIEATKLARADVDNGVSPEMRQEALQRLKHNDAALSYEMEQARSVVVQHNASASVNTKSPYTEKQVDDAIKKHEMLKPAQKEVEKMIKTQEKAVSVREKLGMQNPTVNQGQKKGIRV